MNNLPDDTWLGDPRAYWNEEEAYCPICEGEIDPEWPFCPRCGTNVEEPMTRQELRRRRSWERQAKKQRS